VGRTIGVELVNGETTTPDSIKTCGQTFVVSVENSAAPGVAVTPYSVGPTKIGVAEEAITVGKLLGTPGDDCFTAQNDCPERYM
jgi:hypothetical protein